MSQKWSVKKTFIQFSQKPKIVETKAYSKDPLELRDIANKEQGTMKED